MPEGHLENKWLQTHYAKGHSAQSDLFWRLHFLLLYASKWFFFVYGIWGVLTELGFSVTLKSQVGSLFDESNLRWNIFACEIYSPIAGVVIISDSVNYRNSAPEFTTASRAKSQLTIRQSNSSNIILHDNHITRRSREFQKQWEPKWKSYKTAARTKTGMERASKLQLTDMAW